jgi:hypothetical protein
MGQTTLLGNSTEFTVSELSSALKRTLEDRFGMVRVRGEISGYRGPHSSGHAYFSLKDETAKLDAVVWRSTFAKLKFKPQEGLEVVAVGKITTFPGKSAYQIMIESIEPAGAGALMALLEARRVGLRAEGLFDDSRKRPLPPMPRSSASSPRRPAPSSTTCCTVSPTGSRCGWFYGPCAFKARARRTRSPPPSTVSTLCPRVTRSRSRI